MSGSSDIAMISFSCRRMFCQRQSSRPSVVPLSRVPTAALYVGLETRSDLRASGPRSPSQAKPGAKLMKFRSLHDRVVIRRIQGEEKTKGGIIIPACWPSKKGACQS